MKVRKLAAYRRLKELSERASKAGWALATPPDAEEVPDGTVIYLCDFESGRLILLVLQRGAFEEVGQLIRRFRFSFEEACNTLGTLIDETVGGAELTDDARAAITMSAAAYVRGTKTYETAQGRPEAQFLVVRYRWSNLLRPAAVVRGGLLSPEELEGFVSNLVALDQRAHPDWFPRADVIPFRLRDDVLR